MVRKDARAEKIILTALVVLRNRDPPILAMFKPVVTRIQPGQTLYHDDILVGLGHHPHLISQGAHITSDELAIFVQRVRKVLWLVKRRMARIDIDHELLVGRTNRGVKPLPYREPASDIFRIRGVEEEPLIWMLLGIIVTAYFDPCLRWVRSQDEVQRGKHFGKRLRVDRCPGKASIWTQGQIEPGI